MFNRARSIPRKLRCRNISAVVHDSAFKGFTEEGSSLYEKSRPSYTNEAIAQIAAIVGMDPQTNKLHHFLELGSGTGKFTRSFLSFCQRTNLLQHLKYTATEPSDGFRKFIETSTSNYKSAGISSLDILFGIGEHIPSENDSLDCLIAAQAFHWMANEGTLLEANRVLKAKAPLILIWNTYDYDCNKWMRKIDDEILSPAYRLTGAPRQQDRSWTKCFQTTKSLNLFESPIQYWHSRQPHSGPVESVVDRVLSTSVIAEKPEAERKEIEMHVREILRSHPDLADARESGVYTIDYLTEIAWTRCSK